MQATARIHAMPMCPNTKTLFPRLAADAVKGSARPRLTRQAAAAAVHAVDVDGFFAEQLEAMQALYHWADQIKFDELGNHMASINFVAIAGQDREAVFGPHDYGNVYSMQVRAMHDGAVRIEFSTRGDNCVLAARRFASDEFTREALVDAYSAFVVAAVQRAIGKAH